MGGHFHIAIPGDMRPMGPAHRQAVKALIGDRKRLHPDFRGFVLADRTGGGANPTSWNSAHPSSGCGQEDLQGTGGDGLFYCFAI